MSNKPQLKHRQQFEKILTSYKPSDEALKRLDELNIVTLAGPTCAGRNTIIDRLVKKGDFVFFKSDTTRPRRKKDGEYIEFDGDPYWFVSEEQMLQQLENGQMIEAAIIHNQQVSGASVREFEKILSDDKIAISEIEPVGVDTYVNILPQTVAIFVIPPDFDSWIERINNRAKMSDAELKNRLDSALWEFEWAISKPYYHIVVNDDLESAVKEVEQLSMGKQESAEHHQETVDLVKKLIKKTESKIKSL